ncbi:ABC transporter substrate-binding protein [Actinophytocola algeriensis]|uniref:Peptide/nickel transport system substrate-binding protein n=1 Tax=Actinophytocola algeriensis TaxID=1768010 RepID=A0A7W7VF01_9PSEU|nr:ABC transporter substrate-binding protein [Actinophytocola algeriensis]MBB4907664.1 peptide/nickel transport system substrate-binding protein [Actinophytocola algeriensis]MBE1479694.1 peptide/nickel transport system substrate-binding protein [Actinophytocola algeriensis]
MRLRRKAVAVAAALLLTASLAACGDGQTGSGGNSGGVLNIGMPNGPQTENHNPFLPSSSSNSLGYRWALYEPLVMTNQVKPDEEGKPWLATEWTWSDNFRKLELTIRDNATWSDGKPVTGADIAYTFTLLKSTPALNINAIPYSDATADGNKVTVTFTSSQFVNQMDILTQTPMVPEHVWSKLADPATDTVKDPVGSGPYTLKSFTPQTVTLTVRDKGYWQDLPQVKELRYTSYNDNNAQTTALANGSSEWAFTFISNYKAVYVNKDPEHHKLWFPPVLAAHGLFLNTELKPFDDPVLRRAMNMVINRNDVFMQGEAGYFYPEIKNITGIPTPAGDSFLADEYKGKEFEVDVKGAKQLLTDNGYTYSGDALMDKTGKPVKLTMSNPAGWSDYITTLEILKDNFSDLGIAATVDKANQDTWTTNVDTGQFEAAMHWTNNGATPYDLYQSIMDGALYKPQGTAGVNGNWGRFRNAEATEALHQYANAADDTVRKEAMDELQKIYVEQAPVLITGAANAGGEYSTKNWVGWPDEDNQYAPAQPTQPNALDIILHLKPAS